MKYTIVVISKNRHELMMKGIEQLKAYAPNTPIVVVEAIDKPPSMNLQGVKYVSMPADEGGFSHQRNVAVDHVDSDYIVFADDDITIDANWYSQLTKVMDEDPEALGVMGAVFPENPTIVGFCEGVLGHPGGGFRFHNWSKGKTISFSQVATCNTILKKSVIKEVGGFDLLYRYGSEDTDLSIRVTKKYGVNRFRYAPDARVFHLPRNKMSRIIPWYLRRGKADADLFLKHTTHLDYLLKTSIMLKILPLLLLSIFFKNGFILLAGFCLWFGMQLVRSRFMFGYFSHYDFSRAKQLATYLLYPFIKLTADIMFDVGRIIRLLNLDSKISKKKALL